MKLYEIVKENGASVFQSVNNYKELEKDFLNLYRYKNYSESMEVYLLDFDTLKRKRKIRKYEKLENPEEFLYTIFQEKYPNITKINVVKNPMDFLNFFNDFLEGEELL